GHRPIFSSLRERNPTGMWQERLTDRARDAIARSQQLLERYRQTQLDVEHLLLALVEQPDGVVPAILERLGVDAGVVRDRMQAAPGRGGPASGRGSMQVYVTPRLKRVFDVAQEEAARLRDDFISTEHFFVAILRCAQERDGEGPATRVLSDYGVELEKAYRALA